MEDINYELVNYIEKNIIPLYEKNDFGHGINHIRYVLNRCLSFAKQFPSIDINMIYAIAAFHDIAHHIDKDNHERLSAEIFYKNNRMKNFFNDEQRIIIKEAIEDHRASLEYEPRSDYGKIISSADRSTQVDSILKRTHSYSMMHYPNLNIYQLLERSFLHMKSKYGYEGYAKNYCIDEDYEIFKKEVSRLLNNKWEFSKRYMEVNGIMNIKEKAKLFAINAHMGQVRKSEPDKPMIVHPISVGQLLEEYGYDDNVIAAGYLHDVVEDTKYTLDDIREEFGDDIASLVMNASEPDKSLSWEERKKHTIEETKKLPLKNKLVICADKINNLEDLMIKFQKSGKRDFSAFKRGEEQQRWYYTNVYESLIYGEDSNLPIFKRLKMVIDIVYNGMEDTYLKDNIFNDNLEYYEKLKKLHAQKVELQRLKALSSISDPFVIEFSGTPRTGKTTIINNLYDFFKKGGFKVSLIEEFTTSKYYREKVKPELDKMNLGDSNIAIIDYVYRQLSDALQNDQEIILIDRSINDRQIWNYRRFASGDMPEEQYLKAKKKYSELSKELIDFLVITYADSLVSLKRDYNSSLALENRSFLNTDNIDEYNNCLKDLIPLFQDSVSTCLLLDTSAMEMSDVSVEVASEIMPEIRKKFIKSFKQKYQLK